MHEQTVFIAALEKTDPAERQAFLDEACANHPGLRERVDQLLARHEQQNAFLDASPVAASTILFQPISEGPGTVVGPYKLLQKIGEGGFGVVYMAEQEQPVRRLVALKIIKPGMDTAEVIARFESERQALALMDHPHIARVFDAGATGSGRPYFVMELVKGVPISEFCDKNHMPAEGRLKLFIDVCHAIQHAHHKGIIHRDVKPSNVMVTLHDGVPVVKVIDFGVAKATVHKLTERTLFTAYGQMVGTPTYMSPEQAEMSGLDIDTRSDVYSLGVLLYELLTGTTPLEAKRLRAAGYAEMQRLIREEEPPRPSTRLSSLGDSATVLAGNRGVDTKRLVQLLAGDLDWVVMKALEKDRNRRYDTPGNFAADIDRYLRREAILARPPSTTYRLTKFVQRNRATVLMSAAVALALIVGCGVATWQAVAASLARRATLVALADTEEARLAEAEERQRAEANEQKAVTAFAEADRSRQAAEASAAESQSRLVRLHVADGIRLMDEGDLFSALNPLVEALRLEHGNPEREEIHRIRLGSILRQCPKLVQVWPSEHPVGHAELSPDGQRVLIVSRNVATVRQVESGQDLFPPLVHDQPINMARFSPDGKRIGVATGKSGGNEAGIVQVWDALVGIKLGPPLVHPGSVRDLGFNPRDSSIVTICEDDNARVWTEDADHVLREAKARRFGETNPRSTWQSGYVFAGRFTPDGTRVMVTFHLDLPNHETLAFWNPLTDAVDPSIEYYEGGYYPAHTDLSPDGHLFWADHSVRDAATGTANHASLSLGHNPFVAFSPDSHMLVTGDWESREAQVWDAVRGAKIGRPLEHRGAITSVSFGPDAARVLTASVDGTARVWDARTGKPISPWLRHGGAVTSAMFSPNGHQVLTVSAEHIVRLWDLAAEEPAANRLLVTAFGNTEGPGYTGQQYLTLEGRMAALWNPQEGHRRLPYFAVGEGGDTFDFNQDDTLLAIGTVDKKATVWDVPTGRRLFDPLTHSKPVQEVTFIGDGSRLLTIAQYFSNTYFHNEVRDRNGNLLPQHRGADLRVWDTRTGEALTPVMSAPLSVYSTDLSRDGRWLAAAGGSEDDQAGTLSVWDVSSGALRWHQDLPRPARYVEFSPDGRFLVTAVNDSADEEFRDDAATVWDARTGKQTECFRHSARIAWMGFHPHRPHLVTASSDRTVRVWDYETGDLLGEPLRHPEAVQDAAFIADGRFVASATKSGDLRIWDPASGEPVTPWLRHGYDEYSEYHHRGTGTWSSSVDPWRREWNVGPALHTLDELAELSNLLTGMTDSTESARARSNAQTFHATWQRLQAAYPANFRRSAAEVLNWHEREALALTNGLPVIQGAELRSSRYAAVWHADRLLSRQEKPTRNWLIFRAGIKKHLGQVEAALTDYTAALEMTPRDEHLLIARATIWRDQAEYAKAKADLQRAMAILFAEHQQAKAQLGTDFRYSAEDVFYLAPLDNDLARLCLHLDDQAGYRQACEQLIELSRQDDHGSFLGSIAWTCVLAPDGCVDPSRILAMAEQAAAEAGDDASALRTHGAALFRTKKFDEAATRLREALALQAEFPSAWLFLAMVEHQRGQPAEAKMWFDKAVEWMAQEQRERNHDWRDRTMLQTLLKEVRQIQLPTETRRGQ